VVGSTCRENLVAAPAVGRHSWHAVGATDAGRNELLLTAMSTRSDPIGGPA
jgi:hypothetical protein